MFEIASAILLAGKGFVNNASVLSSGKPTGSIKKLVREPCHASIATRKLTFHISHGRGFVTSSRGGTAAFSEIFRRHLRAATPPHDVGQLP